MDNADKNVCIKYKMIKMSQNTKHGGVDFYGENVSTYIPSPDIQ